MPHMKLKPTEETILVFAFRYALGRKTGAPGLVAGQLIEKWPRIARWSQEQIHSEIESAIRRGDAGDACDVETWKTVLALPLVEP